MTRSTPNWDRLFGVDLALRFAQGGGYFEDADLTTKRAEGAGGARDLALAGGIDNLEQAIANRLKTRRGELAPLGHADYGSEHHRLVGEPNVERTRNLIKMYVLQALSREPRIKRVLRADVRAPHSPPREEVRIELVLEVEQHSPPLAIALPFSLAAAGAP